MAKCGRVASVNAGSRFQEPSHVRDTDGVEPLRGRGPRVALSSRLVRGVASKSSLGRLVSCGDHRGASLRVDRDQRVGRAQWKSGIRHLGRLHRSHPGSHRQRSRRGRDTPPRSRCGSWALAGPRRRFLRTGRESIRKVAVRVVVVPARRAAGRGRRGPGAVARGWSDPTRCATCRTHPPCCR